MTKHTSKWTRRAGFVAAALLAGSAAAAEGPRYTYGEIGYSVIDFDNFSDDADVYSADGSLALTDRLHLIAGYLNGSVDTSNVNIDLEGAQGGLGMHFPLNETVDFVADVAYVWEKVDANRGFGSNDEDGYAVNVGLRAMLTPEFEVNGGGSYADVSDDDTALNLGVVYNFNRMFAITGNVSVGDNATAYGAGLRLYFDR